MDKWYKKYKKTFNMLRTALTYSIYSILVNAFQSIFFCILFCICFNVFCIYFLCVFFSADEGTSKTFTCARPLVGQFVAIQLVGVEGSLSLCEVEVFSNDG